MYNELKEKIFNLVDFNYNGNIEFTPCDSLYVKYDGTQATIGYEDKSSLCRGLFIFAKEITAGNTNFEIKQSKHFKNCGVMIDCSRNAVLTVESAKKYIEYMAALGLNELMLYTEDTYEIKEYPYFGYMRGRYTKSEIQEIDSYAQKFGIELIPCIQTLAHLFQFLKWQSPAEILDTDSILLIDEDKTYEFIECAIKSVSEMFSSKRIHIGMDEAHQVGLGKFLDKNGYHNRFDILNRHLSRVIDICKKYSMEPMMWSDMFFRLASPTHNYYDDCNVPQNVIDMIPDIDMVYWDYYHTEEDGYRTQIKKHQMLNKPVIFAGGFSNWYGHLPEFKFALDASISALKVCSENNIDEAFATIWGDDGNECNLFMTTSLLSVYSEYFYLGKECSMDDIKSASEFLTKQPFEASDDMGKLDWGCKDKQRYHGKSFLYGDILYDLGVDKDIAAIMHNNYIKVSESMKEMMDKNDKNKEKYEFAYYLYKICAIKSDLRVNLQKKYLNKDMEYLKTLVSETLPHLKELYQIFKNISRKMWLDTYKPYGFEVLSLRYGGVISRIDDVIFTIQEFIDGHISVISELEETRLPSSTNGSERALTPTYFRWK